MSFLNAMYLRMKLVYFESFWPSQLKECLHSSDEQQKVNIKIPNIRKHVRDIFRGYQKG